MASSAGSSLQQLPDEMFSIIKSTSSSVGPRLGRLALKGRAALETPSYLAITSRGVVPHLTPDTFAADTGIKGVYIALEDFIERAPQKIPPLYKFQPPSDTHKSDSTSATNSPQPFPLRHYVGLPSSSILVLGARRATPIAAPAANPNTNSTISVGTSVGFKSLEVEDLAEAAERLRPDILVAVGDIPYGRALGSKRVEKATDRTIQWMQDHAKLRRDHRQELSSTLNGDEGLLSSHTKLFAPLLPLSCANQQFYVDCLAEELREEISGVAIYSTATLEDLPPALESMPRLGFTDLGTPHDILTHVHLGLDVLTIPFITAATDAGIALDFSFPAAKETETMNGSSSKPRALGIDMWDTAHATDLSPLVQGCQCYACTNHHRAYLQHLLSAKEMLGWVLLQIHNHHVLDLFFAGIRETIANETFEEEVHRFAEVYEPTLPAKTGQGPRVRGYQFKSEGPAEPKKNASPFTMLNHGKEKNAETEVPIAGMKAVELEGKGFAEEAGRK